MKADFTAWVVELFASYPPGTVDCSDDDEGCIIFLAGSIDMDFSRKLQFLLEAAIAKMLTGKRLLVDMNGVNYISSTGVGAIVNAMTMAHSRAVRFSLRRLQPKVRAVFEILGLISFFVEET